MPDEKAKGRLGLVIGSTIAALLALWLLLPGAEPASRPARAGDTAAAPGSLQHGVASATSPRSAAFTGHEADPPNNRRGRKPITSETERLRARVLDSLDRPRPLAEGTSKSESTRLDTPNGYEPGNIKDRTGELNPETLRVLNQEFSPLIDECYELAHERNPDLRGMLAISLEFAGAEELGTIVEAVEPAQDINELNDPELIECVRQSAFTLQLPMPLKSGRDAKQFTGYYGVPMPDSPAK